MAKVLFVDCYPHSLYGQQQTLFALLDRCATRGIEASVATPGPGVLPDELRRRGVPVRVVEQPGEIGRYGGAVYRDGIVRKLRTVSSAFGYVRRLRRWLRAEQFDCLYCNDMRGLLTFGLAARLVGVPVLIWDKLDQPHGLLDHFQLPLASRNLVISRSVLSKYPAWQKRCFAKRIRLFPDGIAVAEFTDVAAQDRRGGGGVVVAIAGSVTARKGHDLLLPAFQRAQRERPDLRLLVIGDALGEEDCGFRDALMVKTAGDATVEWLGRREDMAEVLAGVDILVSPSRREGLGRVNLEAMAAGIPVVGAAATGIEDVVVEGETGFLVDPTDEAALADRIVRLAADPDLRARMGAAGRRRALAEFDQERQIGKVLDELLDLAR